MLLKQYLLILFAFCLLIIKGQLLQSTPELLCTSHNQCRHIYGDGSRCNDEGKCSCFVYPDKNNVTQCIYQNKGHKVTILGFNCEIDKNCKPENSVCDNESKKCVCPAEFSVESADRKKCLKPLNSTIDECEDLQQCVEVMDNTICQDGKCICSDKYNLFNGTCIIKSKLNVGCFNAGNCLHIPFSECNNKFCRCQDGYIAKLDGSMCLPIVNKLGEICTEHSQCEYNLGKGSQCSDKLCDCKEDFVANENYTYCDIIPYVGKECLDDKHCISRGPETMSCLLGLCRCKADYFQKDLKCFKSDAIKCIYEKKIIIGMLLYVFSLYI